MEGSTITVSDQNAAISLAPGEYHIYANKRSTLGIDPKAATASFTIYPNPASGFVHLSLPVGQLQVYDLTGKLIKNYTTEELKSKSLDISGLSKGLYIIKAEKDGKTEISKLIVD